jgi:tRNA A37 threonylcarbamoyladenosine biosynthesis protein TsaE
MDLYRLQPTLLPSGERVLPSAEILHLSEAFGEDISIVEWPDRIHNTEWMPRDYIRVFMEDEGIVDDSEEGIRRITVSIVGNKWGERVSLLLQDLKMLQLVPEELADGLHLE